jgi:hypothetical protein
MKNAVELFSEGNIIMAIADIILLLMIMGD